MQTILSSLHWVVREYPEHRLVQLKRTGAHFESQLDLELALDQLIPALSKDYARFGIVVDSRSAPLRGDAPFHGALGRARAAIDRRFARVAVLIQSHTGMVQVSRLTRDGGRTFATMSETAAFEFAKGLSVVTRDSSSAPGACSQRIATPDPIEEASHWAKDLDEWAMIREKVISKIDIRGARRARALASEIRRSVDIALDLGERRDSDIGQMAAILDELATLRLEAVELMLGGKRPPRKPTPPPAQSVTASPSSSDTSDRDAETVRPVRFER